LAALGRAVTSIAIAAVLAGAGAAAAPVARARTVVWDGAKVHLMPADRTPGAASQSYAGDFRGCGRFSGSFTISALAYGANGALRMLRLSFEAHCEALPEAIRGSFAFDAAP
jgi:hypothetical protein